MTKQFDLGDSLKRVSNTDGHEDVHFALLQDSDMTYDQVAQKGKGTGGKPGDNAVAAAGTGPGGGEKEVEPTTNAQKQFVAAIKEFEAATDKDAAWKALQPKIEGAIKTADDEFPATMEKLSAEAKQLAPEYKKATEAVATGSARLQSNFAKVPEGEQEKVESLINSYALLDRKDPIAVAIERGLAKYPDLMSSVKALQDAQKNPALQKMEELKTAAGTALEDRVTLRMAYAQMLKEDGQDSRAEDVMREAAKIMGIELPPKKDPPGVYKA